MMFEPNRKLTILKLIAFVLVMLLFSVAVFSQQKTNKAKGPGKDKNDKKVKVVSSDTPPEAPEPTETPDSPDDPMSDDGVRIENLDDTPAEKSIKVDSKVIVFLDVIEGDVRINGWNRDEVRAYISGGSQVGFRVLLKNKENGKPSKIQVLGHNPDKTTDGRPSIFGKRIEIDVPYNSNIVVKSNESSVWVDSINKINIENANGDITLNNIKNGVDAKTFQGDLILQNSGGATYLNTTDGNITVSNVEPKEIDDAFKAESKSGAISIRSLGHMQVSVKSLSGMQKFDSPILSGGQYRFSSYTGQIQLFALKDISCRLNISLGNGSFKSDFVLKDVIKTPTSQGQKMTGLIGSGDADMSFSTANGFIRIIAKRQ